MKSLRLGGIFNIMNDIMFSGMYHIDILYIYKHVSHAISFT